MAFHWHEYSHLEAKRRRTLHPWLWTSNTHWLLRTPVEVFLGKLLIGATSLQVRMSACVHAVTSSLLTTYWLPNMINIISTLPDNVHVLTNGRVYRRIQQCCQFSVERLKIRSDFSVEEWWTRAWSLNMAKVLLFIHKPYGSYITSQPRFLIIGRGTCLLPRLQWRWRTSCSDLSLPAS